MTAISRSRRSASGIALIVAGALLVLAVLLPLLGVTAAWFTVLAYVAIAIALGILGIGAVNNLVAKISLIAAAVGWLLLGLHGLGLALTPELINVAALVAGIGGVIGAVVIYVGKEISNTPALVFLVAAILGLIYLLVAFGLIAIAGIAPVIGVLFGVALILAGVLFRRTEGSRR
jgi:hypothetical protein